MILNIHISLWLYSVLPQLEFACFNDSWPTYFIIPVVDYRWNVELLLDMSPWIQVNAAVDCFTCPFSLQQRRQGQASILEQYWTVIETQISSCHIRGAVWCHLMEVPSRPQLVISFFSIVIMFLPEVWPEKLIQCSYEKTLSLTFSMAYFWICWWLNLYH